MRAPAVVVAVLWSSLGAARANGSFQVDPTRVELDAKTPTAAIALTNRGATQLRLQLEAQAWTETEGGAMQLGATNDLVVRPALVALAAGETRTVRVAVARGGAIAKEGTYRVFFSELPDRSGAGDGGGGGGGGQIHVLARVGVPVFVVPAGATPAIALATTGTAGEIAVTNTGGHYVKLASVELAARTATGTTVWTHAATGWYVLAGARRSFALEAGTCRAGDTLVARADGEHGETWTSAPFACPAPSPPAPALSPPTPALSPPTPSPALSPATLSPVRAPTPPAS